MKDDSGSENSSGTLLQNNKKALQKREDLFLEFFDVISKTKTDYGKTSYTKLNIDLIPGA